VTIEPLETRLCLSASAAHVVTMASLTAPAQIAKSLPAPQVHISSFVVLYEGNRSIAATPSVEPAQIMSAQSLGSDVMSIPAIPVVGDAARIEARGELADRVRLAITERIVHAFVARVQELMSALMPATGTQAPPPQALRADSSAEPGAGTTTAAAAQVSTVQAPVLPASISMAGATQSTALSAGSTSITILENAHPVAEFVATTASALSTHSAEISLSRLQSAWERIAPASGLMGGSFHAVAGRAGEHAAKMLAQTATSLAGAAQSMAQLATDVISAPQRAFEIAYLGSPFTLLSDSVAAFTDDSLAVTNHLPKSEASSLRSSAAWTVTASVLAADLVLLTYINTRSRKRFSADPIG
jgi:hypothetical protein